MSSTLLEFLRTYEESFRSRSRLASLYSDFASRRSTNPENYAANSTAWLKALTRACQNGLLPSQTGSTDKLVLHCSDSLSRALETDDFGQPLSLGSVVQDAVEERKLVPVKEFLEAKTSIYVRGWIPTPWQTLEWGLRLLGLGKSDARRNVLAGDFVVMDNLEAATNAVLQKAETVATSNTSRIFSRDLFVSTFSTAIGIDSLSRADVDVLLTHLARDREAIAYSAATGTVKFAASSKSSSESITPEDVSIANLRMLISTLEPRIVDLERRVMELDGTAREAVASKQLHKAKAALRKKKLAEGLLAKRSATLRQLEEVYTEIEQAADNVQILQVLESSSKALASLNKQTGGVEHVQDVMDGLREQIMDTEEIQTAINEPAAGTIDEGEVDDELEALEKVEKVKEEEATKRREEEAARKEAAQTEARLAEMEMVRTEPKLEDPKTDAEGGVAIQQPS